MARTKSLVLIAVLALGLSGSVAQAASVLRNLFTDPSKCLDIVNDGHDDTLTIADCGNYSGQRRSQHWRMSPSEAPGYHRLTTEFTGRSKCLDVVNDGTNDKLRMADCGNYRGQRWSLEPTERPGSWRLKTQFTGPSNCLDVINDGRNNRVHMAPCGNYSGQFWSVSPVVTGE